MSDRWTTSVSNGSGRLYGFVVRQPSWVMRAALIVAGLVLVAVLFVLIVPAVILGVAAFVSFALIARTRAWLGRLRSPNGALDGRRNVRVIARQ